jgi:hypothetical protein
MKKVDEFIEHLKILLLFSYTVTREFMSPIGGAGKALPALEAQSIRHKAQGKTHNPVKLSLRLRPLALGRLIVSP